MNRDQQNKFDKKIREELNDLRPDYIPQSWDMLSDRLIETPDPTNITADEHVREALNGFAPTYDEGSWEALSKKIDERNNTAADSIIVNRLDKLAAPAYRQGSWALLAARLELISLRRSCLAALKITEFSLLLSALLLFWNFFPYGGFGQPSQDAVVAENSLPVQFLLPESTAYAPAIEPGLDAPVNRLTTELGAEGTETNAINSEAEIISIPTKQTNANRAVSSLPIIDHSVSLSTKELELGINTEKAITPIAEMDFVPQLPINLPQPGLLLPLAKNKIGEHSLRVFVSPWDFNRVVTPAFSVREKEIERDVRLSHGFSAGVLIDHDHGKNGHSYGIVYGRRSYVPTVFANVEGLTEDVNASPLQPRDTNYSRIIFHAVGLPFNYQREMIDNGRWRLAATAGVEANIVLSSKFYKSPNFDENINNYLRSSSPIGVARSANNPLSKDDLTNPEEGLLQGGSALRNSSLYFTLGFSLERRLSQFSSVFIAPQFSRALYYRRDTGLGPFDDRIHPNSIRFGVRYRLGQ